jgi:hypothetical protein
MHKKNKYCVLLTEADKKRLEALAVKHGFHSKADELRFLITKEYLKGIGDNNDNLESCDHTS